MADESGGMIMQKVGPLPLVVWVMGGAGVVFVFLLMKGKSSSGGQAYATNQLAVLAPTEAEAFGTLEQQQQDVSNALTTLGNNQAALGGSLGTLSGTIDTNQNWDAAQFANILGGIGQVQQGQTAQANQAANYQYTVLQQLRNYYSNLSLQSAANIDRQFADFTWLEAGPSDPRVQQWIDLSSKLSAQMQPIPTPAGNSGGNPP